MDMSLEVEAELERARQARRRGNEGQARVCARRAAGIAAREYFSRRGQTARTSSAYDLLRRIAADSDLPPALHTFASHLILRVDEEFRLPSEVDLLEDARGLCEGLMEH